jgi:two-component system, NtrC family, sensor histidine kinase KinB
MLRWRLTLGLLTTVAILLFIGIYGVWLFDDLGRAIDKVLRNNYDSIKVCHYVRVATARVNTFYARSADGSPPNYEQTSMLNDVAKNFAAQLPILQRNAKTPEEQELVQKLEQTVNDYVQLWRTILQKGAAHDPNLRTYQHQVPQLTLSITNLSEKILGSNESQMLIADHAAKARARTSIRLLLIAMVTSLAVFVFTYLRLGSSIIKPIRQLRDSIRVLRHRKFDQSLPVRTDDELGELTREFNQMAVELRNFYRETDRRFIELNQVIRAILNTLPYPLFILQPGEEIADLNPAAQRLLDALQTGRSLPPQLQRCLAASANTGPSYQLDDLKQALLFRIDEQEFYYLPRVFTLVKEDGTTYGRALMLIDVTRFRWLDEMKTDLLATLSHEIKTPLTGIRLVLHLLLERRTGDLTESQEELVTTAWQDCERLLQTLKSILDLARLESGKAQLQFSAVGPQRLVRTACETFNDLAESSGRELVWSALSDLPPVYVDADRFGLVLANFLSNAVKYSFPASKISVLAQTNGPEYVRFSVINYGPGLSEIEQAKVFDKFYRSHDQRSEGAGLGLSIARQIVQAHDGRIGVKSEPGEQTEFWCDLLVASRAEQVTAPSAALVEAR